MAASAQNSATLQWTPPSEFTDGSELVPERDLEGYGVYMDGVRVAIAPPNVTTFVLEGVEYKKRRKGTWELHDL